MTTIDTLIVGQGLAGSLLAWALQRRGQRVLVLDDGHRSAASTVAAGLLNPITGQRLVKGPEVDECLPAAQGCYRELERELQRPLFHPLPIWRLFQGERECQAWEKRRADPAYQDYLGAPLPLMDSPAAPLGGFVQRHSGYLDTRALLAGMRERLQAMGCWRQEAVDYRQIVPGAQGVVYRDLSAKRLIFCEGWQARHNPWFADLPLAPSRGTILTLHSDAPWPSVILNQGRWLMPRGGGEYRLGASYDRERLEAAPDSEEIAALRQQLLRWFPAAPDYRITAVESAVRPNTRDKRPLLGVHPQYPGLGVFNGFGSRGSLLIPWHAERMAERLCDGLPLPEGVDIRRYG